MFREIVRKKNALPQERAIEILKNSKRGVLAVLGDDDYPYAVPLNHYYNEADGKLYFHGGMCGHRVDAVRAHSKVSFCVMEEIGHLEGDAEWISTFHSVIVFGRMEEVTDREQVIAISRELSHKFTDDEAYIDHEVERSGAKTLMFVLTPEHITCKQVKEA